MESKLKQIEEMKAFNPIFDFVGYDNEEIIEKKRKRKIPHYELNELIMNPKQYYVLTLQISSDLYKCSDYYENVDIIDLYTFYMYKTALNYEPYWEQK